MNGAQVIRVESEACNDAAVYIVTIERSNQHNPYTVDVDDLPRDIRHALTNWLAGKQP